MDKGVTLIAPHTEIAGDIRFSDQLYISGHVTGSVFADNEKASLVVTQEGRVTGEVRVPNIVINGAVEGDVYAGNKVELAAQAKVKGNLFYKLIEMHLGALVEGQLVHEDGSKSEKVHQFTVEANSEES